MLQGSVIWGCKRTISRLRSGEYNRPPAAASETQLQRQQPPPRITTMETSSSSRASIRRQRGDAVEVIQTIAHAARVRRQCEEQASAAIPRRCGSVFSREIDPSTAVDGSDGDEEAEDWSGGAEWLTNYDYKQKKAAEARIRYILAEEGLDPTDDEEWCVIQAMFSVLPTSFMEYASHWRALRRARLPISDLGAKQFIVERVRDGTGKKWVGGTYKHLLSSIIFYNECYGLGEPRKQTMRMIQGITAKDRLHMRELRGGITADKLRKILRLSDSIVPREYKDYFILLHATGMRGNQLGRTLAQHIYPMTDFVGTRWVVLCPANHKGRCTGPTNNFEYHATHAEWADDLRRIFAAAEGVESGMLAPTWSATLGNKYLKAAASHLKWDSKMIWVVHGLRHGSAIDAANKCEGNLVDTLKEIQRYTGHISPSMLLLYSKSNEARQLTEAARREIRSTLSHSRNPETTNKVMAIIERGIQRRAEVRQNHAEVKSELVRVKAEQAKFMKRLVGGK